MEGHFQLFELERGGVEDSVFDLKSGGHAFSAIYLNQMISLAQHANFPRRFPGRILQRMNPHALPFSALGVVIGNLDQAFELSRLQLAAFEKGYYSDDGFYPIYHLILRLLADHLRAPSARLQAKQIAEPALEALSRLWRSDDLGELEQACLAACDFHTHRCKPTKSGPLLEFDNGSWTQLPVEILLLFKLRMIEGLANPVLDHPLMNSALGHVPPTTSFDFGELIDRVRLSMEKEGFDKSAIVRAYL